MNSHLLFSSKSNTGAVVVDVSVAPRRLTRTEGISVRVMTRTEGISLGVIRMLSQLAGFGPIERAIIKSDVLF